MGVVSLLFDKTAPACRFCLARSRRSATAIGERSRLRQFLPACCDQVGVTTITWKRARVFFWLAL
jgi:hypothetical protein